MSKPAMGMQDSGEQRGWMIQHLAGQIQVSVAGYTKIG
jgi:hypothetical protein